MTSAHQLAKLLLDGPDIPVLIPGFGLDQTLGLFPDSPPEWITNRKGIEKFIVIQQADWKPNYPI